jgi:inner membrane transporter RhtA
MKRAMTGWQAAAGRIPVTLWLLTAVFLAQFAAAISVPLIHQCGSMTITALRMLWAAGFLLVVARPRFLALDRRRLMAGGVLGLTTAAMAFFFFAAVSRIPIGAVVSIEFIGPLTLALAGSRRPLDVVWAAMAALGVWLLTRGAGGAVDSLGYGFAAASAVCWAGYIVLTNRVGRVFTGVQGLTLSLSVAALVCLPIGILPHVRRLTLVPVLLMALIALLSPVTVYSLEMACLRRMEPRRFGILMSLEPLAAAVMGFLVLGQRLSLPPLLGMACVTLASLGTVAAKPKKT